MADNEIVYERKVKGVGDLGAYLGGIVNILISIVSFIFGSISKIY